MCSRFSKMYSAPLNDGKWHHVCVTWNNANGDWSFFTDGSRRISGSALAKDHVIQGGGVFMIGQSQSSYGGSLDASESFVGEISQLNVWGKVLQESTLLSMANNCSIQTGDVLDWRDFREHIDGDLQIVTPSGYSGKRHCCDTSHFYLQLKARL